MALSRIEFYMRSNPASFLMTDLTHERPNVYYEIGHAHARDKRVILFRKKGAKLHFDVAHRNCPAYENTTQLKQRLRKRLEAMTNMCGFTAVPIARVGATQVI